VLPWHVGQSSIEVVYEAARDVEKLEWKFDFHMNTMIAVLLMMQTVQAIQVGERGTKESVATKTSTSKW